VFTARYALSPYIKQIHFVFKGLMGCTALTLLTHTEFHTRAHARAHTHTHAHAHAGSLSIQFRRAGAYYISNYSMTLKAVTVIRVYILESRIVVRRPYFVKTQRTAE
jgi:hypothetical protein